MPSLLLVVLLTLSACNGGGGSARESPPTGSPTFTLSPTARPSGTPTAPAAPSATPSATGTASATTTPSPSLSSTPNPPPTTPRGEIVIGAKTPVGVITAIPGGPTVGGAPAMPAQVRVTSPAEVRVETFVRDLVVPWSLAFAPDARLFVSERPGRVRVVTGGVLQAEPWATLPVAATGEGGLLGLTIHPDFPAEPWIYICYTFRDAELQNRISRIREVAGRGGAEEILVDHIPGGTIHDGCRLKFGPDGKLYASTGETGRSFLAQDLDSLAGKILRLEPDGTIPTDNPFGPNSLVYSYGHRNPQGLAFDPFNGHLFATEHGPSGEFGQFLNDEVNLIVPGANYGWPEVIGAPGLPQYRDPLLLYADFGLPPTGATFYSGRSIPSWGGDLLFTSVRGESLQRIVLGGPDRTLVLAIERLFEIDFGDGVYGRLRDIVEGPDGALYMATSNRDGRGQPAPDDDRILRLSGVQ